MRLSHVGIAVKDWEKAVEHWKKFTKIDPEIEDVPAQHMRIAIFNLGNARVELIGETSPESPVSKFLDRKGTSLHHLCLEVEELDNKLESVRMDGLELIDQKPRIGSGGTRIAFFNPRAFDGVLIELSEKKE